MIAVSIGVLYLCALTLRLVGWPTAFTWLWFVYLFSYVKLFITLIKYLPQVWVSAETCAITRSVVLSAHFTQSV